jgi:hypothetical protein
MVFIKRVMEDENGFFTSTRLIDFNGLLLTSLEVIIQTYLEGSFLGSVPRLVLFPITRIPLEKMQKCIPL